MLNSKLAWNTLNTPLVRRTPTHPSGSRGTRDLIYKPFRPSQTKLNIPVQCNHGTLHIALFQSVASMALFGGLRPWRI